MIELKKIELKFQPTLDFTKKYLMDGLTIAKQLLKETDFTKGSFFTLLPQNAHLDKLYSFDEYGILYRQNLKKEKLTIGNQEYYGIKRPTVKKEIFQFLFRYISNTKYYALYEDVIQKLGDSNLDFFKNFGISYSNELYYLISPKLASEEILCRAMDEIFCFYHSLIILFSLRNNFSKEFSTENIHEICINTHMIIINAYHGEGYIFWEKL